MTDKKNASSCQDYGWGSCLAPCNCDYLTAPVIHLIKQLGVGRVLDIGCGNGYLCDALFKEGIRVVGIDCDQSGINISKKAYPQIPFYCIGVEDGPRTLIETEGVFDLVVSTEVVEHLFAPHLLAQYASEVLCTNGYLLVSTPYHGYLKNLLIALFDKWDFHHQPLWHGGHIKFWSRHTLTQLFESNNFDVKAFKGVGRVPLLWKSMLLLAQKRANP